MNDASKFKSIDIYNGRIMYQHNQQTEYSSHDAHYQGSTLTNY